MCGGSSHLPQHLISARDQFSTLLVNWAADLAAPIPGLTARLRHRRNRCETSPSTLAIPPGCAKSNVARLKSPFQGINRSALPPGRSAQRERAIVTSSLSRVHHRIVAAEGVYAPQQDSQLLTETL